MMSASSIRMDRGLQKIKAKVIKGYSEEVQPAKQQDEDMAGQAAADDIYGPPYDMLKSKTEESKLAEPVALAAPVLQWREPLSPSMVAISKQMSRSYAITIVF